MDKQDVEVTLLSDDELDTVAGGFDNIATQVYGTVMNQAYRTMGYLNGIYAAFAACHG